MLTDKTIVDIPSAYAAIKSDQTALDAITISNDDGQSAMLSDALNAFMTANNIKDMKTGFNAWFNSAPSELIGYDKKTVKQFFNVK